jgi:hypothetical protein
VEGLAPEVIKGQAALKSLHDRLHEEKTAGRQYTPHREARRGVLVWYGGLMPLYVDVW